MYLNLKVPREIHLSNSLIENVKYVVVQAEREVANDILKLPQDVVILTDTDPNMIDPNIGVGGYTNDKNQIQLSINPKHKNINAREIFATLVHELSHVKRAYGPWYGKTFFDYLVFEGLAISFEEEVCGNNTYYPNYIRKFSDAKQLVENFKYMFDYDDSQYDYMDFVNGNSAKNIPKFAVYSMGLFIVEKYLKKTKKHASESLLVKSEDIKNAIGI